MNSTIQRYGKRDKKWQKRRTHTIAPFSSCGIHMRWKMVNWCDKISWFSDPKQLKSCACFRLFIAVLLNLAFIFDVEWNHLFTHATNHKCHFESEKWKIVKYFLCKNEFVARFFLDVIFWKKKNLKFIFTFKQIKKTEHFLFIISIKTTSCNFHLVICFMSKHACLIIRSIFFINKSNVSFEKFCLKRVKEFEMKTLLRRNILIGCKNGTNKKYEKCLTKCWIRFHSESCRLTV